MQTQHLIIIATVSAIGLLLMVYFIRKTLKHALARSYARGLDERNALHSLASRFRSIILLRRAEYEQ